MRLFRFGARGHERPGMFDAGGVRRDISAHVDDIRGTALAPGKLEKLARLELDTCPAVNPDERFGACVAGVGNFIAVGLNYADHAAEAGAEVPKEPVLFNKAPSCIIGPDDDVHLPKGATKADWEVELAIVIGEYAWRVPEREAPSVIAGYCICNDLSERSYQLERGGQWTKGKGCPTFGPLGPWLVTPEEIPDVQSLDMWLDLNGERMQQGSTRTMIFGPHYLVSYISYFMALEPGDVITTGTPPGVGLGRKPPRYLRGGDVIELEIAGLGRQRQRVVD